MKIVKIQGGLGNQMFQYAFAKAIAKHSDEKCFLDISVYKEYKLHKYCLDKFNTIVSIASEKQLKVFKKKGLLSYFRKPKKITPQLAGCFEPIMDISGSNIYYDGYFQTEKYFLNIRDELLKDFTLKNELDSPNKEMLEQILKVEAVSLHIRRGDYLNLQNIHGLCGLDYYERAMNLISQKVLSPHFFVFSDDIQWAKENLKSSSPIIFVDINDAENNQFDLWLMKSCKHNIIANSSFSWWGAWLNESSEKVVVAPDMWFVENNDSFKDIIPSTWHKA